MKMFCLIVSIISVIGCSIIYFLTCIECTEWGKYEWVDKVSTMVNRTLTRFGF